MVAGRFAGVNRNTFPLELLRDAFLIAPDLVDLYSSAARDYLAGITISTDLFSKLAMPSTPENVALIPMAGVLTKADICGGLGSRSLTNMVEAAAVDPAISSIIIFSENCPGGQVDGTRTMAETIARVNKIKPVMGAISGMACSAATWILTQCQEIFATSSTDLVGCIGVMARMRNPKSVQEGEADYITIYSDLSPDKNKEFNDPDKLRESYLNPVAKIFQHDVLAGRGDRLQTAKENVLTGKTYIAGQAQKAGLIDGILPIEKIISRSLFLSKIKKK